jgi:ABC-2 type transport system permease protein
VNDLLTVARKELFDVFAERQSLRGVLLQTLALVALTGVAVPAMPSSAGALPPGKVVSLYLFFPAVLAALIAADALAGERERKTLETLLATPLTEGAILFGKAFAAVAYASAVALVSVLASQITAVLRHFPAPLLGHPLVLAGVVVGAAGASLLTASIALGVALWVPVVRAVQQIAMLASAALVFASPWLMDRIGWDLAPAAIFKGDAALLAIGLGALAICRLLFRRERFFERR